MARLPTPGSDDGTWGQVLNDFLAVAHDTTGNIKANAINSSALQDNSVSGSKLQDSTVSEAKLDVTGGSNGQVLTKNSVQSGGLEWTTVSGGAADATTTSKGIVQLAGDLAGTAAAPTVPGLASKASTSTTVSAGTGLTGGGDLSTNRTISANFGATAGTIAQGNDSRIVGAEQTANKGAASGYASLDGSTKVPVAQLPDATTGAKGIIQLTGDLGGTATSPTVPGLTSKAATSTTISAGTGLTGGGDLSANRTISANFGVSAGTIAQGNDSRITGAEQTANKGAASGYASLDGSTKVPIAQVPTGTSGTTVALGNHTHTLTFSLTSFFKTGTLATTTGTQRLPVDGTYTIVGTRLMVGTAPTGADIIVDINKNGTTIYTTQGNRPTITASANAGGPGATPDITSLAAGDYLTVDIDQIGSSVAGSDLTVSVIVSKTV